MIRAAGLTRSVTHAYSAIRPRIAASSVASGVRTITFDGSNQGDTIKVTLPETSFETYELENGPSLEVEISQGHLMHMYREMNIVRRMEMAADALYKAKEIRGFCHLSIGQEAVAVGMEEAITNKDTVITSYRCHGFAYTRGAKISAVLGELMGKENGLSRGKGGSMHMFTDNFYGGNGIVGAQVPLGLGIGFAHKYRNDRAACFALYGDGAANQGQVFESFNMAKLWDVPVVFCCENNKYGMGTSTKRSSAMSEFYKRGQFIPGLKVNGMDVLACYAACKWARDWCITDKGPLVMEFETYRYGGHSMSDPGTTYRTREEIANMRSHHDCITGLKNSLIELGVADEKELRAIDKEARAIVDKEVKIAEQAEFPKATQSIFYQDVYVPGSEPEYYRGRIEAENMPASGLGK